MCPICTLQHVQDSDALDYLLAQHGCTKEAVTLTLQKKFSSLDELWADIKRMQEENDEN